MKYASQEKDHQEENHRQKENDQEAEKGLLLRSLRNRDNRQQRGDGSNQTDVLRPRDEAEDGKEKSLLTPRTGWGILFLQPEFLSKPLNCAHKNIERAFIIEYNLFGM